MTDDEKYIQIKINQYIDRSFRDIADQDYLAARALFAQNLDLQGLWAGLQAIEKYLKGILLYSRVSAKKLGHDIEEALRRVKSQIKDIPFDFPDDVEEFVAYLNYYGPDRYFETQLATNGKELLQLDRSVWHIRRYCFNVREVQLPGGGISNSFNENLAAIASHDPTKPASTHIFRGHLEQVLAKRNSNIRKTLVWKNFYFGANKRQRIQWRSGTMVSTSSLLLFPEIFGKLDSLVQFSPSTRVRFNSSS